MATIPVRYRHCGVALVRATTDPGDLDLPAHVDLGSPAAVMQEGRAWLAKVWSRDDVREALSIASPDLAARVDQLVSAEVGPAGAAGVRRAILSTAAYLLRWRRRPTPFGMFAGVSVAAIGPAVASVGRSHTAIARADGDWLSRVIDSLERHQGLRRHLLVVVDGLGFVRDGRFIVASRAEPGARNGGPLREVSVRYTRPVQAALAAAASPVRFETLAAHLAARFPATPAERIDAMLHSLVDQRVLITNLRPPMTTVDGLGHLVEALRAAGVQAMPDLKDLLDQLEQTRTQLQRHNRCPDSQRAAYLRASTAARMPALAGGAGQPLAVDVRLDASITVPETVMYEAARAASALLRLSTRPFGSSAWLDYHAAFRTRYGEGALVPVRELVADSGLGYPGGYLGARAARRSWRMLNDRDVAVLARFQQAALEGAQEVVLTDADLEALTVGDHADIVLPQRIELGVTLHAASTGAVDRGDFTLWVTAAPKAYTSMAGRFAYLLDQSHRDRLTASYASPSSEGDAVVAVQLSFPPRRCHDENVVQVPPLMPQVVSLSEHPTGGSIDVDDLAVTADSEQMYLVQRSTGRRVAPRILHALDTTFHSPPLVRFIAEVAEARTAVFGPLDLGVARTLPHTPRIRYRRTVLMPARWILTAAELLARENGWDAALDGWRRRWRVPARVVACHGGLHLPLDLDQPLERTLLRSRLERAGQLEIQEDPAPEAASWIDRPAELLIPMTAIDPKPRPRPATATPGVVRRPGDSPVVNARLVGNPARFDDILTRHLPALAGELAVLGVQRWWVRRHRDLRRPEADQHLAVFLRLAAPDAYGQVARRLAGFAADLQARGLPADLTLASYASHPGRYGNGQALVAAEQVFATDTRAAIAQIEMAEAAGIPAQPLAAASMAQLAAGFASDRPAGYRALLSCLTQQTGQVERRLSDLARTLSDPADDFQEIRRLPRGEPVAAAWRARDTALDVYHRHLATQRNPATVLRTLLHEHHVRALGVDPDVEQTTFRLARTAALRRLAAVGPR